VVPYLNSDPQIVARWRDELSGVSEFKIGIAWQGSRTHRRDRGRSIPLSYFAPLAAQSGVRLYSLQKNFGQEQLGEVSFGGRIIDLAPRLESFVDTAAVMENLDLVICCDTSVAHLAGALARPVWVAVATVPDWRWLLDRDDTPWYPTMRLFRQHRRGDWHDVFARITSALAELIGAPMDLSTLVRIGPGELIDRVTRLEIALDNVGAGGGGGAGGDGGQREELMTLDNSLSRLLRRAPEVAAFKDELKTVHASLLQTEREIDECRRGGDFGPQFVELARTAYAERERQRQILGMINDAFSSEGEGA
ncbi:MAG TPA: glycosyltransferase family 9 protein, partial [Pirellulales bacterium]|nr:glycosyltransferase family 9 protein [Pirellulales bacterium]